MSGEAAAPPRGGRRSPHPCGFAAAPLHRANCRRQVGVLYGVEEVDMVIVVAIAGTFGDGIVATSAWWARIQR